MQQKLLVAGLVLQSIIAEHVDCNILVLMASLDLSAAFHKINNKLLIKCLKIIGLPYDISKLVKVWLFERCFYANMLIKLSCGMVHGSILGPVLYAIYVPPI
jgi:hypothetical protein